MGNVSPRRYHDIFYEIAKAKLWFYCKGITNKHLGMWFKNQGAVLKTGLLDGQDIAEFSVAQGKLLRYSNIFYGFY